MNNFHVIMKQITKFDGRRADEFLEWGSKVCASFSLYNKTVFNVVQGHEWPSELYTDQETTCATWEAANQDLYSVLFFAAAGSTFFVVRKFQGKPPAEGAGHGHQAWPGLHEKFDRCSRAAIQAEHIRMASTRMRPGQDPDDYLYHMDSCWKRLNACDPPEGPTDRQYEDIILHALPSEYGRICQTHLERRYFDLADIHRVIAAIYRLDS